MIMTRRIKKICLATAALSVFLALSTPASPASGAALETAPLSETFVEYVKNGASSDYRPSPLDLSHLAGADYSNFLAGAAGASDARGAAIPRKYDLREFGLVTPVKDQGNSGNCWAYAALGSLESTHLKKTGVALDLSEDHLTWFAYRTDPSLTMPPGGRGGYDNTSVSTLANWIGPVLEDSITDKWNISGLVGDYKAAMHLENAFFLGLEPLARSDSDKYLQADGSIRKRLMMEYGAISVGLYSLGGSLSARWQYLDPGKHAWFYNGGTRIPDHSVLLIGWDDDYPRTNFVPDNRPIGNGAWLAKNSWGVNFGDDGFFWISYEDVCLTDGVAFIAGEADNFDNNYGHDELGWCSSSKTTGGEAWMANVFLSKQPQETLEAVSFYTTSPGASYEIYIYTNLTNANDPDSGTLSSSVKGREDFAGYHTVRLPDPVYLESGASFSVAVRMTTPGYAYPIPIETPVSGYSSEASIEREVSFVSSDGSSWLDAADDNANVCVRAFTSNGRLPARVPASDVRGVEVAGNGDVTIVMNDDSTRTASAASSERVRIEFTPSDVEGIQQGEESLVITLKNGSIIPDDYKAVIHMTSSDGGQSAAFPATVYTSDGRTDIVIYDENRLWSGKYSITISGDPYSALDIGGTLATDSDYASRDAAGGGCNSTSAAILAVVSLALLHICHDGSGTRERSERRPRA
jgi:C1A family cysteine protease